MRINGDIIYEHLARDWDVTRTGAGQRALRIRHIAFYDPGKELSPDCVYLARASDLAQEQPKAQDICFVCVGGMSPPALAHNGNTVLTLARENDILEAFNAVQEVFLKYEYWNDALDEVLDNTLDIREMIVLTTKVLGNPIQLVDDDLRILVETVVEEDACGDKRMSSYTVKKPLDIDAILDFKDVLPLDRRRTEPYLSTEDYLNINLFLNNRYIGVLTLKRMLKDFSPGDYAVFEYFARRVLDALRKQPKSASSRIVSMKKVFMDLLKCVFVKRTDLCKALGGSNKQPFFCFEVKPSQDGYILPLSYICRELEAVIPGSMVFEHDSQVAAYVQMDNCPHSYSDALSILDDFLARINLQAGVSNVFTDVLNARFYFRQACCAIEAGRILSPDSRHFLFSDYALFCILLSNTGDMPPRFVCPGGLLQLHNQDKQPNVDYWETLKTYLDNEMNATLTAKQLYLHRSTLLKRLKHIDDVLGVDIRIPVQRLYIQVCMYLLDLNEASTRIAKSG
jgi:hypothetical protein